jgi:3-carboxy-cis,cis-muconate cycloisomerase
MAAAAAAAARLATAHRDTIMIGRTLLQQAVPVTFGLVAAGWLTGLDEAAAALDRVAASRLAVQFGGAAGTLSALGDRGPEVVALLAAELGLQAPTLPWHTDRLRIIEIAGACAGAAGVLGKIARDVTLLAQSEVGEVTEGGAGGRGGSSAMPHKRNPAASIAVLGCTRQVPGLVATLAAAAEQEHQRAAGAWHAEWEPLAGLLRLTGSAASWAADLLSGLEPDPGRMRRNLGAAGGFPMAERAAALLAPALGRTAAHDLLAGASAAAVAEGRPLGDALLDRLDDSRLAENGITPEQVTAALDPAGYLGAAAEFVDAALTAHARAAS